MPRVFSWSSVPLYYSSFIISKRSFGWWCHRQHNLQTVSCLSCVFKMNLRVGGGFAVVVLSGNPRLTAWCLGGLWAAGPTKGRQDLVPPLLSLFNHTKQPAGGHFVWLFKAHSRRLILKTLLCSPPLTACLLVSPPHSRDAANFLIPVLMRGCAILEKEDYSCNLRSERAMLCCCLSFPTHPFSSFYPIQGHKGAGACPSCHKATP